MTTPSNPPPQTEPPQESSKAVPALVLSIVSWVTCGILLSIPALILARLEIKGIETGRRSRERLALAQVAFWVSVANIAVSALMIPLIILLLLPTVFGQAERARASRAKGDIHSVAKANARMRSDTGNTTEACLLNMNHLVEENAPPACGKLPTCGGETPPGALCWGGPYLTQLQSDPWGQAYSASMDAVQVSVTVTSNGPDGVANTQDDFTYVQ